MFVNRMLSQFEHLSLGEKIRPSASFLLVILWRKAEQLRKLKFRLSSEEIKIKTGLKQANEILQSLESLERIGAIRKKYTCEGLEIEINSNLFEPFQIPSEREGLTSNEQTYLQQIENKYIQLRASGTTINPQDYESMKELKTYQLPLESVITALEQCFAEYVPRYPGDNIKSFRYCLNFILSRHHNKGGERFEKHPKRIKRTFESKSKVSRAVQQMEEYIRKQRREQCMGS